MKNMQKQMRHEPSSSSDGETEKEDPYVPEDKDEAIAERPERNAGVEEEEKLERVPTASDDEGDRTQPGFAPIRTTNTRNTIRSQRSQYYDNSPFDLDRVNTRESFKVSGRSRTTSRASSLKSGKSGKK